MTLPEWNVYRNPQVGESIIAYAQEQMQLAVVDCVENGYLNVCLVEENGTIAAEPFVQFSMPDAAEDDTVKRRTLAELLQEAIYDHSSWLSGDTLQDQGKMLEREARIKLARLRGVLRQCVNILDGLLPDEPSDPRS